VAAAMISQRLGSLDASDVERIKSLLQKFGLPTSCPGLSPEDLSEVIRFDKKTTLGRTRWVLVEGIGKGITGRTVAEDTVRKVLKELCR
ncbi:MAG: 3-dehydroquinate synthase, partial [Dehalococcoidia bacterium]